MERIKLAIERARQSAEYQQPERFPNAADNVRRTRNADKAHPPSPVDSAGATRPSKAGHALWAMFALLTLGLVTMAVAWTAMDMASGNANLSGEERDQPNAGGQGGRDTLALPTEAQNEPVQRVEERLPTNVPATARPMRHVELPGETRFAQIEEAVHAWRKAWSERDMVTYFDAYSDLFTPPDGMTRQEWMANRYRNVGGRQSIEVSIRNLNVEDPNLKRVRVSFLQDYVSGAYRESGRPKTLELTQEEDGRWRIVAEWQGKTP